MRRFYLFVLSCVLVPLGCVSCGRSAPRSLHLIVLADVSASIVPEAREQMFAAIRELARQLSRGDAMTVIPVAGDASGNLQGRILRFEVPRDRESYDADLKRLHDTVASSLASLERESAERPASYTDILGSLAVAREEVRREPQGRTVAVFIFSDFLEDDRTFTFGRDKALRSPRTARVFAEQLAKETAVLPGIPIFCGELRSSEWLRLDAERRAAVREFWTAYLAAIGGKASFAVDGPAVAVETLRAMR